VIDRGSATGGDRHDLGAHDLGARDARDPGDPGDPDAREAYDAHDSAGVVELPDGGQLAYQLHGRDRGCPLLLIRPLGGAMALWGRFRAALAEHHRVISFDLRGAGQSSADPAWVTTRSMAGDGLAVLDHLQVERAHVFGLSLGGMIATWLAILAPRRVARLAVAAAPTHGWALTRVGLRRDLTMASCLALPRRDVEAALVDRVLSRRFREACAEEVRAIEAKIRAEPASRRALVKHAAAGLFHDARRELNAISAPTLVLVGADDLLLGTEAARALARAIPGAHFAIVANSGHDVTLEQPADTAARVLAWLRGEGPSAAVSRLAR
jgi:3-oxoadipate enol-lactonase